MISDYQARKNEVLDSYKTVEQLIKLVEDNALEKEIPNPIKGIETLLLDIRKKAEQVRADRFSLMIAGEAKSGKSTFINAYLGVELLPMDVKQCTSAIIEINNGEEFYVQATYANGREEKVAGDSAAKEFLKKNAALDDKYRDIPVPTINNEILVKSGRESRKKGMEISVLSKDIESLLVAPEVKAANIHNMPPEKYNQKIKDYIEENKNNWQDIVTKIEVFYPLSEEMRGIQIIDSPGVLARGGVANITSEYVEKADAIIFLKPISGQALESTQFNEFMSSSSVERNKNALFLVLTRATNVTPEDLRQLEDEAYQQFSNLDKRNILIVDSKAELYAKQLSIVDDVKAELVRLKKEGTLDDFVVTAYSEADGLFEEGNFIEKLQEKSRFNQVYNALDAFGRKAHYILLGSLLDSICELYGKLWSDLNTQMNLFHGKAEDPTELEKKIVDVKKELDEINRKMHQGVSLEVSRFLGDEGEVHTAVDKAFEDFKTQVASIDEASYDAIHELERHSIKKIDEFKKLTETLQKDIVSVFDKELTVLSDKSTIPFESLKPNFTESTFNEIRESTESKADEIKSFKEGRTFKTTNSRSEYSKRKHYDLIKTNITSRLKDIREVVNGNLHGFTEKIQSRYIEELKLITNSKKEEMDAIMEAKISAEKNKEITEELNNLTEHISLAKSEAKKLQGGIQKNVQ